MRLKLLRPALIGSLFLVGIAHVGSPTPAAAQGVGSAPTDRHDDRGADLGLLGLVGLAGLLGLRRRDSRGTSRMPARESATSL